MKQNRLIIWSVIMLFIAQSCIKQYEPDISDTDTHKIVVTGVLTDQEGMQYVEVSLTTSIYSPKQNSLKGCNVILINNKGSKRYYTETNEGKYQLWLNKSDIDLNASYHIEVTTPGGQHIISTEEGFSESSDIDKIHFKVDGYYNNINNQRYDGLQFYIDHNAKSSDSRFYLYRVIATSEFHTKGPIEWWYDGVIHHEVPMDKSKMLCWLTEEIKDVYVLSTENLNTNNYQDLKLNFTNNHSQRLQHLYSLNILQYAISKPAFAYWKQMQTNMHQSGGLYNNQPYPIQGNLMNTDDAKKNVLGYFMVTTKKEKRIFIQPQGFDIIDNSCDTAVLRFGVREIDPSVYPAYLAGNQNTYFGQMLSKGCVNCESQGGTTIKPSFWP